MNPSNPQPESAKPDAHASHGSHQAIDIPHQDSPHSFSNRLLRMAWGIVQGTIFRLSPKPLHRLRNLLLRMFGARLHPTARVYPRCRVWAPWNLTMGAHACLADDVDCYNVRMVTIGPSSTVSQYSYLCGATHDHEKAGHPLVPLPITLGANVWLGADVYVAPGVTIGDGTVVGARSSVFKDLPLWTICVGSPAKPVKERTHESRPATGSPQ
jgi:putative colanic acid biosynthesis acetyltransferase WcaF